MLYSDYYKEKFIL